MKLYAISMCAFKTKPDGGTSYGHRAAYVTAIDDLSAEGWALTRSKTLYPQAEGWYNLTQSVLQIPKEIHEAKQGIF